MGAVFVELSSPYDPSGITALLAARTNLDFIGCISTSARDDLADRNPLQHEYSAGFTDAAPAATVREPINRSFQ
jgi:hypothetical protein